jgi:hypothetical protein
VVGCDAVIAGGSARLRLAPLAVAAVRLFPGERVLRKGAVHASIHKGEWVISMVDGFPLFHPHRGSATNLYGT